MENAADENAATAPVENCEAMRADEHDGVLSSRPDLFLVRANDKNETSEAHDAAAADQPKSKSMPRMVTSLFGDLHPLGQVPQCHGETGRALRRSKYVCSPPLPDKAGANEKRQTKNSATGRKQPPIRSSTRPMRTAKQVAVEALQTRKEMANASQDNAKSSKKHKRGSPKKPNKRQGLGFKEATGLEVRVKRSLDKVAVSVSAPTRTIPPFRAAATSHDDTFRRAKEQFLAANGLLTPGGDARALNLEQPLSKTTIKANAIVTAKTPTGPTFGFSNFKVAEDSATPTANSATKVWKLGSQGRATSDMTSPAYMVHSAIGDISFLPIRRGSDASHDVTADRGRTFSRRGSSRTGYLSPLKRRQTLLSTCVMRVTPELGWLNQEHHSLNLYPFPSDAFTKSDANAATIQLCSNDMQYSDSNHIVGSQEHSAHELLLSTQEQEMRAFFGDCLQFGGDKTVDFPPLADYIDNDDQRIVLVGSASLQMHSDDEELVM